MSLDVIDSRFESVLLVQSTEFDTIFDLFANSGNVNTYQIASFPFVQRSFPYALPQSHQSIVSHIAIRVYMYIRP